jgi:hypothetical protein
MPRLRTLPWPVPAKQPMTSPCRSPPQTSSNGTAAGLLRHQWWRARREQHHESEADPRFADAVRAADPRVHYRRGIIGAALGFLAGVGLLLAGVVLKVILIAVAGFAVMLACSLCAVASYQRMTGSTTGSVPSKDRGSGPREHAAKAGWLASRRNRADGAARGALAAAPAGRPLIPGCPLPSRSPRHGGSLAVCSGSMTSVADEVADGMLAARRSLRPRIAPARAPDTRMARSRAALLIRGDVAAAGRKFTGC